jgi:molecular chaperone DnaK
VKEALAGTNLEAIKDSTEKLVGVSQSFSQRLYEQASASASAGGEGGGFGGDGAGAGAGAGDGSGGEGASDDDVVDAEIVDEQ